MIWKGLITLGLIAFLVYQLDVSALLDVLASTKLHILFLAVLVQVSLVFVAVTRWKTVLRNFRIEMRYLPLAQITWIGNFFSLVLPSSIGGDVFRAYFLARRKGQSMATTLTTTVLERSGGLGALLIIGLAAVSVEGIEVHGVSLLTVFLLLISAYLLANLVIFNSRLHRLISGFLTRLQKDHLNSKLELVYRGLHTLSRNPWAILKVLFFSIVIQFLSVCIVWIAAQSLSIDAPFPVFLIFVPLINLSIMVPLTINGFGLRESLYLLLFAEIGLQDEKAVALSLLNVIVVMAAALPGGVLYSLYKRQQDFHIPSDELEMEEKAAGETVLAK